MAQRSVLGRVVLLISDNVKIASKRCRATDLRRREILDAALVCFLENGVRDTSMEQIRIKANASNGSVYHLFRSKDEIAFALFVEGMQRYYSRVLDEMSRKRTVRTIIRTIIETHLNFAAEQPGYGLYLTQMGVANETGEIAEQYQIISDQFNNELYSRLAPFVKSGEINKYPAPLYCALILGPTTHLCRAWLKNRIPEDPRSMTTDLVEAAWKSLRVIDS